LTDLPAFEPVRVLCIGDVMLDRFIFGDVRRISPESPVPIIQMTRTSNVPGGAANVARNVAALGGCCSIIGVVGDDATGRELAGLIEHGDAIVPVLVTDASRPTIEKIRFVAQGHHLLRADREDAVAIATEAEDAILAHVEALITAHDVVVLSDYAKGVLTDRVIGGAIARARAHDVPVVVDPKSRQLVRYAGATVLTPNAKEVFEATGVEVRDDASAASAARDAMIAADVDAMLVTRSEQGMTLVESDGTITHLGASAREVFDVVGAGDTVVATIALCLGAGMALPDATMVANVAAGVVVGKQGTATVSRSELGDELVRLSRVGLSSSELKLVSAERAVMLRQQWEKDGLTVGFTNGCFDILHVGHVRILEFARAQCDRLIVGINSDASVKRLKGPTRPINTEDDRAQVIGAFGFVDAAVVFDEDTPYDLIARLGPDVLVKGSDYTVEQVVGHDIIERRGGKVVLFDLVPGRSTSNIIARSRANLETPVEIGQ
jgi:D-beta-D-heptose 7-phosphate kinase/D-beta-D-heptose 1-phosphate adenosyltransferase